MQWILTKHNVLNIRITLFITGIYDYLIFRKLAHVAFCEQTVQLFFQQGIDIGVRDCVNRQSLGYLHGIDFNSCC